MQYITGFIRNIYKVHINTYPALFVSLRRITFITLFCFLSFTGKPERPSDFKTTGADSTGVRLSWIPGFHGGENQTFVIQHKSESSSWSGNITVPGSKLQHAILNEVVTGLNPDTRYTFRIYAFNKYGRSDYADSMPEETTSTGMYY